MNQENTYDSLITCTCVTRRLKLATNLLKLANVLSIVDLQCHSYILSRNASNLIIKENTLLSIYSVKYFTAATVSMQYYIHLINVLNGSGRSKGMLTVLYLLNHIL